MVHSEYFQLRFNLHSSFLVLTVHEIYFLLTYSTIYSGNLKMVVLNITNKVHVVC